MTAIATGAVAGVLVGALLVLLGVIPTAWIALAIAVIAITAGAVHYVRTH